MLKGKKAHGLGTFSYTDGTCAKGSWDHGMPKNFDGVFKSPGSGLKIEGSYFCERAD